MYPFKYEDIALINPRYPSKEYLAFTGSGFNGYIHDEDENPEEIIKEII